VMLLEMIGKFPMFMRVPPKNRFIEIAELSAFIFHQTDKLEVTYLTVSKTLIPRISI